MPSSSRPKNGAQRAEFEKLTEEQRRHVTAILCGIRVRDVHEVPATREALDKEVNADQWEPPTDDAVASAIGKALKAPDHPDAAWIEAATAQAERIEWPDPASLPRPDDEPEEDDWKDGYAAVPYPVIDKLLHAMPGQMVRVYLALLRFESYEKGTMYPGQDRVAALAGMSSRQAREYIAALHAIGLVTYKRQPNMPNIYHHVPVTAENWKSMLAKLRKLGPRRKNTGWIARPSPRAERKRSFRSRAERKRRSTRTGSGASE
jgi:hypothetical protein